MPITEKHNSNKIKLLTEQTLEQNKKINDQNKEKEKLTAQQEKKQKEAEEKIASQRTEIVTLKSEVERYKNEDRFSNHNPIPKGFRSVQLFEDYKELEKEYSKEEFSEDTYYNSFEIEDKLFSTAIYYPAQCGKSKVIKEIRFFYRTIFDDYNEARKSKDIDYTKNKVPEMSAIEESKGQKRDALLKIFNENFGKPVEITPENDHVFLIDDITAAMINDAGLYILARYTDKEIEKICNDRLTRPSTSERESE